MKETSTLIKPYFIENRIRILIGLLSLIAVDILQLVIPRIIKRVVDGLTSFTIDVPPTFTCLILRRPLKQLGITENDSVYLTFEPSDVNIFTQE